MEAVAALAMFIGLYDVSHYSAVQDRMRFPNDYVLREWYLNNKAYQCELAQRRASLELLTQRPAYRYELQQEIDQEVAECERISRALWQMADVNFGHPPIAYNEVILRSWMRLARESLTEEEYRAGYFPYGGYPAPDWRRRIHKD